MAKFKIGDRVKGVDYDGNRFTGTITHNEHTEHYTLKRDDGRTGSGSYIDGYGAGWEFGSGCGVNYKIELLNKLSIMSDIKDFAKSLMLSSDEKLLRKHGLKDSCGSYTSDAKDLVINKLISENEKYLVELATKKEAEEKKD